MAVIGGVTHSNIARLSKTSSALSSELRKACFAIVLIYDLCIIYIEGQEIQLFIYLQ